MLTWIRLSSIAAVPLAPTYENKSEDSNGFTVYWKQPENNICRGTDSLRYHIMVEGDCGECDNVGNVSSTNHISCHGWRYDKLCNVTVATVFPSCNFTSSDLLRVPVSGGQDSKNISYWFTVLSVFTSICCVLVLIIEL